MKLSEIAIKVTNRNRKTVIGWLESINKPSDNKHSYIHKLDCYLMYINGGFIVDIDNEEDRVVVKLSQAKAIYQKENRPQPTHQQLKSERGRSAMYKMKYEQAKSSCHRLNEMLREANEGKQQMIIANGKTIKELDLYKDRVVELENNNDTLVNEKHKLHSELLNSEEDAKSYRVNLEKMKKYINELEADKRNLTAEVSVLRTSKSELHILTDELKDMNEIAINEKYSLKGKLFKAKKQRDTAFLLMILIIVAMFLIYSIK